ncbi:MAG: gamma-glutamyltransferase [Burkholderiales bacterium]|nr:gamma-glutamyltransferase [Burkholderiales bacterium]
MNFKLSILVCILFVGIRFQGVCDTIPATNPYYHTHIRIPEVDDYDKLAKAKHDMVVTDNVAASKVAFNILHQGGNAVDAAIAAAFILSVVEPQNSGLGGSGYALYYNKSTEGILAFDGIVSIPQSYYTTHSSDKIMSDNSAAETVAIPGEFALLYQLHQKEGKLSWEKLLLPAIQLAENGFALNTRLYNALVLEKAHLDKIPQMQQIFLTQNNEVKPVGTIIKNLEYANTLKLVAANPNSFYRGKIAKDIIDRVNKINDTKILNLSDFKDYMVLNKKPICSFYREKYQICSVAPLNSGGVTLEEFLLIYSQVYYPTSVNDINWIYYFIQASKLAYADRSNYTKNYLYDYGLDDEKIDYDYLESGYIDAQTKLISQKPLALQLLDKKNSVKTKSSVSIQDIKGQQIGATAIAIVDENDNAINLTLNLKNLFGSKIWVDGFFLNNVLKNFNFPAYKLDKENSLEEEEQLRPPSTMTPSLVMDEFGNLKLITNSPGGTPLICYVAKNIILMLDFNLDPYAASKFGNLCSFNNKLLLEANSNVAQYGSLLKVKNESVLSVDLSSSEVSIIRGNNGYWYGASDPRETGLAIGD